MNFLAIDAGNTRIKWGLHDGQGWLRRGAVPTAEAAKLALPQAERAIASNVAGAEVGRHLEAACRNAGAGLQVIASEASALGITNGYRSPGQLGTDRWAALIAAHRAVEGHKIVANAGTALTIDALDAGGFFLGGLIVPGPALMRGCLDRGTAQLRLTEGSYEEFPRSTPDAITTGALMAAAGAVMKMAHAMAHRGCRPRQIVLSGGAAPELAPHLPFAPVIHENLVLDGLVLLALESTS
jgi:type III pantothenate kinase